jgi:flagellar biosynthesis/type III secretory pathway chaperone
VNASIDPRQCQEHLGRLLTEEGALLTLLESQLVREHQFLTANDVDGLEAAGNDRQACVAKLLQVEDERSALCRMLGKPTDMKGVEALLAWCDPEAQLLPGLRNCTERATRCRDQNLRNGVLVSARLQRVSNMLGMLNVVGSQSQVYGRSGTGNATATNPGRLLSASA